MRFQKHIEALEMTHFWAYQENTKKMVRIVRSSKTLHASIIMPVCREMIKTCTRGFYLFSYNTILPQHYNLRDNFLGKIVLTLLLMTLMGGTCLLGVYQRGGQLFIGNRHMPQALFFTKNNCWCCQKKLFYNFIWY